MAQFGFGTGLLVLITSGGFPQRVGTLKDVSLEISTSSKEMKGDKLFAVDIARAGGKCSGKAKTGQISGGLIAAALGTTATTGSIIGVPDEIASIPAASSYTITVSQSPTQLQDDLGVIDLTAGVTMVRVASAPTTGQYSLNTTTGVYTFAAADASHQVAISYSYKSTTVGKTISLTNQPMGSGTTFQLVLFNTFRGRNVGVKCFAVTLPKLGLNWKNEDYTEKDLDIECFADAAGRVVDLYTGE
jgi:hypothetical protein